MPDKMNCRAYAETYGPTVGDRIRLADTEVFIEVEQDYTISPTSTYPANVW